MRIILTGGGSGGHIFPLIAVVRKLRVLAHERGIENITFLYVGPRFDAISEEVVRWCTICGSVVVDLDYDSRVKPGGVMKMRSPEVGKD